MGILCTDATPKVLGLFDFGVAPQLLFYAYIPIIIISLFFGFFVFFKNKSAVQARLILSVAIIFSFFLLNEIVQWISVPAGLVNFSWRLAALLQYLVWLFSILFFLDFIEWKTKFSWKKTSIFILGLPIILFLSTNFNLAYFDLATCGGIVGGLWTYLYSFQVFSILFVVIFGVRSFLKETDLIFKKKILLITIGFTFFFSFFAASNIYGELFKTYEINLIGPIGMVSLIGFLTYLIVKYKTFNIKLLGAQALIVAQFAIIASMFAFATSTTNYILLGVTLTGTTVMGWYLIKSVKLEVQRKEELQGMSDKLAETNDQLRKLDNSKSEFISIASHQLRTPLTAIKGFISLLLEGSYGKIDPKQQDVLNKVYTSNERLVNLVEDLLNISRMESGRMEFKFAPWEMNSICQEVMDTFMPRAKGLGLYLEYKAPTERIPEVMIDGTKVREVISNMVDNALKYTPKGGVTLKVEMGEASKYTPAKNAEKEDKGIAGPVVRVIVSDTGIGVPQTELPYLFAKFSRGKDISRLNTGGTGLGLYVGRSMIENNGGRIWAESDGEGKGSRFIIEIPIQQSKELLERWG